MWVDVERGVLFSHAEVKALAHRLVEAVAGSGVLADGPSATSGGQRRRVELAVSQALEDAPRDLSLRAPLGELAIEPAFLLTPDMPNALELLGHLRGAIRAAGVGDGEAASAAAAAFTVWQRAHASQPGVLQCPSCGRRMFSPDERCSGSFTDTTHPQNVTPVRA